MCLGAGEAGCGGGNEAVKWAFRANTDLLGGLVPSFPIIILHIVPSTASYAHYKGGFC